MKRQLQKSPTSIGDGMNADLSYFSVGLQTPVPPVATLSVQKTLADIEELSLRTPRPVATTE
ncbi:hypothetical protein [Lysinibacillus xylanilyticus]|uniref:hypothetical protein n=1 Tax=Lysinibacillus xylanilyticus TaxID=582475 RepID=UPI003D07A48A